MSHNNQGPTADGLSGQFAVSTTVSTYNLTAGRVNLRFTEAPAAFSTDGATVPAVGGTGTQVAATGASGSGVVTVTLGTNTVLKVIGGRAGLVFVSLAP